MTDPQPPKQQKMSLFRTWTGQSQKSYRTQKSQPDHLQNGSTSQNPPSLPLQKNTPGSELNQVTSRSSTADPFSGHLNHLSEHQGRQLEKFKTVLFEQKLYRPAGEKEKASHDDQTLLRFLRARKFDIQGALGQFKDTEIWYKKNMINELYETIDVDFYEKARSMYPQWTGHRDRRGIPVYVYVVKYLDTKTVNGFTKEANAEKAKMPHYASLSLSGKLLPLFALYESLIRYILPLCTSLEDRPNPEVPVTNSNNIVDIHGVGLKQFWNLKSHMQESSLLATSHYPETLDRIFILGAPSFFPTVWGWIKRWFDPVTVSKIFILSDYEAKARLSEFIDPDDFPKRYGGNLDWDFGQPPHLDKPAKEALERDGHPGWIYGPCLWENGQRVPVGTSKGKSRRPAAPPPVVQEQPIQAIQSNASEYVLANEQIPSKTATVPSPHFAPVAGVGGPIAPNPAPTPLDAQPHALVHPQQPPPPSEPAPPSLPPTSPPSMTHSGSTASTSLPVHPSVPQPPPTHIQAQTLTFPPAEGVPTSYEPGVGGKVSA